MHEMPNVQESINGLDVRIAITYVFINEIKCTNSGRQAEWLWHSDRQPEGRAT
jgi:hypothetical protein